jgi:hypothetical protein
MTSEVENKIPLSIDHLEHTSEDASAHSISAEHQNFLLQYHGTTDLDPVPSMDPADPLNWPSWKVES